MIKQHKIKSNIKKYTFKEGLPQEFEIVGIADLYKEFEDTLTTPHRTGFYHIIWFQKGYPTHLVDFNPVKIEPNTLLFLNKDIVQRFDSKNNYDGKVILFTDSFFCKTENDIKFLRNSILFNDFFSISQIQVQKQSKLFTDLLEQMTDELQNVKDTFQADILQNLLQNFLLYSERERRKQNFTEIKQDADFDYVMLFKQLLETGYKNQKKVNYYAKEISITEKRLNLATTKVLGKTPKEIINDRIMLEAKRILAHTTESVKEITFNLGFEEPTNFIKYFKKHCFTTPVEFREKNTLP
ncbi:AraC-like DNA-binding protein [Flavobacterium sp. 1]|uniref:AraC family transcriptional regulator n=1 Tax=Flavobacterium sp. 1 TaxID=2035200 RepID=UPI000C238324|nr:helix-turn-helix transcriptional regulator [Flavobacterium sp. 1]PJJ08127.1 AraC-like DNA-binding protein [Flavobacterium sp. 1]